MQNAADSKIRELAYGALMVALVAVCAQITIPLFVPITLQVFGVLLAGFLLGPRVGFWSIIAYLLVGFAGLPVFAGARGGPAALTSPTLGYLLAFPPAAAVAGAALKSRLPEVAKWILGILAPVGVIYAIGVAWLVVWSRTIAHRPLSFAAAISVGVVPFVAFDILKGILALWLAERLRFLLKR